MFKNITIFYILIAIVLAINEELYKVKIEKINSSSFFNNEEQKVKKIK